MSVKQLYTMFNKAYIRSALSSQDVLIQSIALQIKSHQRLEEVFLLHAEGLSHFNTEEVLTIPYKIKKEEDRAIAQLYTVSKETIQRHLEQLKNLSLEPDSLTLQALGLIRYIQSKLPQFTDGLLIHMGSSEILCLSMENGELKQSYAFAQGVESLFTALWEDRKKVISFKDIEGAAKQIDLSHLKANLNPHLAASLDTIKKELTKIMIALSGEKEAMPLIMTGYTQAFTGLEDFLKDSSQQQIFPPIEEEESKHAIAIGLTFDEQENPEFLQGKFFPKKIWKKAGIQLSLLGCCSIILSFGAFFYTTHILESKKMDMVQNFQNSFKDASVKLEFDKQNDLQSWFKMIAENSKECPYIMKAPQVAKVLSWIYEHPLSQLFRNDHDPLEIQSFHYELVQYPTLEALQDPYQAKIQIEFKIKNPMYARKFHDAVVQDHMMVDPSCEIEWEVLDSGYRIAFYLKNQEA